MLSPMHVTLSIDDIVEWDVLVVKLMEASKGFKGSRVKGIMKWARSGMFCPASYALRTENYAQRGRSAKMCLVTTHFNEPNSSMTL